MKIHHELTPRGDRAPLALAIGVFDGLHRGHQALIKALIADMPDDAVLAALTFRNHPQSFLAPGQAPELLVSLEKRINLLAAAGIQELYVLDFNERVATLEARQFLEEVLLDKLRVKAVAVGASFRFGAGRRGDADLAREVLEPKGVIFHAVEHAMYGDQRISSTRIRAALAEGRIDEADAMLGYPYGIAGFVQLGAGRGHDLGFPTANIRVASGQALPADGVYTAVAQFDGCEYQSLVSIGTNPTFDGQARSVEVWIKGFDQSLYGRELRVRDLRFLRGQEKFTSVEALEAQMKRDAASLLPICRMQ